MDEVDLEINNSLHTHTHTHGGIVGKTNVVMIRARKKSYIIQEHPRK